MKIVIPGGSGQVGTLLARAFQKDGHEIVVLGRDGSSKGPWRVATWDARTLGGWAAELEGADCVINLAGKNVNCRYGEENRRGLHPSHRRGNCRSMQGEVGREGQKLSILVRKTCDEARNMSDATFYPIDAVQTLIDEGWTSIDEVRNRIDPLKSRIDPLLDLIAHFLPHFSLYSRLTDSKGRPPGLNPVEPPGRAWR